MFSLIAAVAIASNGFACPLKIVDSQKLLSKTTATEVVIYDKPKYLENMDVYIGHPDHHELVEPIFDRTRHQSVWYFTEGADVWIDCRYRGTSIVLRFHVGNAKTCVLADTGDIRYRNASKCVSHAP